MKRTKLQKLYSACAHCASTKDLTEVSLATDSEDLYWAVVLCASCAKTYKLAVPYPRYSTRYSALGSMHYHLTECGIPKNR